MFGKNLRYYRLKRGLTKTALAEACGISKTSVKNYEDGRIPESMDVVERLASVLGVKVLDFISSWDGTLRISHGEFRKQSGCRNHDQEYVREAVDEYLNRFCEVINLFGEHVLPRPPQMHAIKPVSDVDECALLLRQHLKLSPIGPICNLIESLENLGIIVFTIEFARGAKFSGMNGTVNGRPFIVLNDSMPPAVRRSTIAHELVHIMFDWSDCDVDEEVMVFVDISMSTPFAVSMSTGM